MLKVVGASWLQTRFATYILVAVALLGIGAIIIGEFGLIENDGIYAATVSYYKEGYHIDFWGQGNDLTSVRLCAARAYYKTGISESGWSIIEIETSSKYPDSVQAYAAGLLEGSLTWQLIHRHWYNTVRAVCERRAGECRKLMRFLRENTAIVRKRAEILAATDPFWHMVRLFYIQLDGLEAGWKFAARRSRQEGVVEMDTEHFLWLAMANLMDLEQISTNDFHSRCDYTKGMIILKSLPREGLDPLIAIGHTTAAPYVKMLRLLKKYTFAYHTLPKKAAPVPGRTVVMSSYPGALSSQDEFYLIVRENRELIVAGTLTAVATNRSLWNSMNAKDQVMSPVRVMAANRLATDGHSWSRDMSAHNVTGAMARQWVTLEPREGFVHFVEQSLSKTSTRATDITERFANSGAFWITGEACPRENTANGANDEEEEENVRSDLIASLQKNITTIEQFEKLMGGHSDEQPSIEDKNRARILTYRGDLKKATSSTRRSFGVIDAKIVLADGDGLASFDAISGPSTSASREPFSWSKSFPNISHLGQPDVFDFDSVTPMWVWI